MDFSNIEDLNKIKIEKGDTVINDYLQATPGSMAVITNLNNKYETQGSGVHQNGDFYMYMGQGMLTSNSAIQSTVMKDESYFNDEGFAMIDGRYLVATTRAYGDPGTYIDIYLDDGTVIPAIIGDSKGDGVLNKNPDQNVMGMKDGSNIIEWVVNDPDPRHGTDYTQPIYYGANEGPGYSNGEVWNYGNKQVTGIAVGENRYAIDEGGNCVLVDGNIVVNKMTGADLIQVDKYYAMTEKGFSNTGHDYNENLVETVENNSSNNFSSSNLNSIIGPVSNKKEIPTGEIKQQDKEEILSNDNEQQKTDSENKDSVLSNTSNSPSNGYTSSNVSSITGPSIIGSNGALKKPITPSSVSTSSNVSGVTTPSIGTSNGTVQKRPNKFEGDTIVLVGGNVSSNVPSSGINSTIPSTPNTNVTTPGSVYIPPVVNNQKTISEKFDNKIDNVANGNEKVFTAADLAIKDSDGISAIGSIWKDGITRGDYYKESEYGFAEKITEEEAKDILKSGKDVVVSVNKDDTTIGFVKLEGEQSNATDNNYSSDKIDGIVRPNISGSNGNSIVGYTSSNIGGIVTPSNPGISGSNRSNTGSIGVYTSSNIVGIISQPKPSTSNTATSGVGNQTKPNLSNGSSVLSSTSSNVVGSTTLSSNSSSTISSNIPRVSIGNNTSNNYTSNNMNSLTNSNISTKSTSSNMNNMIGSNSITKSSISNTSTSINKSSINSVSSNIGSSTIMSNTSNNRFNSSNLNTMIDSITSTVIPTTGIASPTNTVNLSGNSFSNSSMYKSSQTSITGLTSYSNTPKQSISNSSAINSNISYKSTIANNTILKTAGISSKSTTSSNISKQPMSNYSTTTTSSNTSAYRYTTASNSSK